MRPRYVAALLIKIVFAVASCFDKAVVSHNASVSSYSDSFTIEFYGVTGQWTLGVSLHVYVALPFYYYCLNEIMGRETQTTFVFVALDDSDL